MVSFWTVLVSQHFQNDEAVVQLYIYHSVGEQTEASLCLEVRLGCRDDLRQPSVFCIPYSLVVLCSM